MIPAQFFLSPLAAIGRRPILVMVLTCTPFVWAGAMDASLVDTAQQFLGATAAIVATQYLMTRIPTASVRMLVASFASFVFCISQLIQPQGPEPTVRNAESAAARWQSPAHAPGEIVWTY